MALQSLPSPLSDQLRLISVLLAFLILLLQVKSVFLVVEPRSRVSRGFAFVTMETPDDASRCVKHLNQSVLEGRYITVERVSYLFDRSWCLMTYLTANQSL